MVRELPTRFLIGFAPAALSHERPQVRWDPGAPRQGDPVVVFVTGLGQAKTIEGNEEKSR